MIQGKYGNDVKKNKISDHKLPSGQAVPFKGMGDQ
jgi:hypothetical protein